MEQGSIRLALIYGSTREGRFCDTVSRWVAGEVQARGGFELDVIDPAVLRLPPTHERTDSDEVIELRRRIGLADAFIVVTPELNHGYPAALKHLIDSVYAEWQAKPVAFVSYGGVSGGLRAVEQLRLVFAELHAVTMRDGVSFAGVWDQFDAQGRLLAGERFRRSAATMLSRLAWWAQTLRAARQQRPYAEALS